MNQPGRIPSNPTQPVTDPDLMNFKRTVLSGFIIFLAVCAGAWASSAAQPDADSREDMVLIPEGTFVMGSMKSLRELDPTSIFQADRHMLGPEDPAHDVYLSAYYIDRFEVTNAAYAEYLEATGQKRKPRYWDDPQFNQPRQPVVGVSWKEAQAYCRWRGKRLPTEAEWEKAARGKRPVKYPWGDSDPTADKVNYNNEVGKTAPVGSYEAGQSDYGVHDLSGNVAEWVQDWHWAEYYLFSPKKDPQGPEKGHYKIIRGGNWQNNKKDVRLTYRNATVPSLRQDTVGFRCAASVPEAEENKTAEGNE